MSRSDTMVGQTPRLLGLRKAVRQRGGDGMINVTVEASSSFWILFMKHSTTVEGDVIRFER